MSDKTFVRRRWGDNDRNFGPLTFARDGHYRPLAVVLSSGDEEYSGASLRISGFGFTMIVAMPYWAPRPYREKKHAGWDKATIERLGRDWYWDITRREYGFSLSEGFLNVSFGRQTMDSSTEQSWGYFFPWTQWRHVRHSYYGLEGEHIATLPKRTPGIDGFRKDQEIAESTPTRSFEFDDFDGERITATTMIEEREWHFGTGWFKWLSWFRKPKISRSLDLRFSSEVGQRKGSWKGGTLGHGIEMLPGELHEAAFIRYCAQNDLTFIGSAPIRA